MARIARITPLLLLGLLLLCTLGAVPSFLPDREPAYETAGGWYDLERRQADDRATVSSRTLAADLWNLLPPVMLAGVVGVALAVFYQDRAAQRRRLHPDVNGFYPLPDPERFSADIAAHLTALLYSGQNQALIARHAAPEPRRLENRPDVLPAPPTVPEPAGLPTAPSFAELLAKGFRPTRERMLLGYSQSGPIYGGIDSLLSTAIAGRPGQGKSTALRFVYAQTIAAGGLVAILDPHGSLLGDLGDRAPCVLYASDAGELDAAARWLEQELESRLAAFKQGRRDFQPLLVLCDEWPVISMKSPAAVDAAARVILEMRKAGGYALISGQGLPAGQFGGSLVRDALSSRYVFRTSPAQGRMAGLDKESARMVDQLDRGRAIFAGPVDPVIVAIPNTTTNDLAGLARTAVAAPVERSATDSGSSPLWPSDGFSGSATDEAEIPRSADDAATGVAVPDDERSAILQVARSMIESTGQIRRKEVCRRVYDGRDGGQAYRKVQTVLDGAGL